MPQSKKRVDGIGKLSPEEKRDRDARAQYWMNQRKIERVAEAAARHGRTIIRAEDVEDAMSDGTSYLDDDGELVIVMTAGLGKVRKHYRVTGYQFELDNFSARCIETEYIADGSN